MLAWRIGIHAVQREVATELQRALARNMKLIHGDVNCNEQWLKTSKNMKLIFGDACVKSGVE